MTDSRTNAVLDRVRVARERRTALRVQGAGTWPRGGRPVASEDTISLQDDRGIIEYVPGDLTLTARAGTTLAEIETATKANGQWLAMDPWGSDAGTIGATVSTATAGPHAFSIGLPRDVVLGVEMVTGAGQIVRAGGRVVKNVAGFDLTRLAVGSWGTLGVITEVTVRLRARPEATGTVALAVSTDAQALGELAVQLRAMPFTPLACELIDARMAARLGLSTHVLLVRLAGNRRAVAAQLQLLRTLGQVQDCSDGIWYALREVEPRAVGSWRWSQLPSVFGQTWSAADRGTRAVGDVLLHGSPLRGVVRVIVPEGAAAPPPEIAKAAATFGGTVAIESLPGAAWRHVELRAAEDPLSRSIRGKFDPARVLNRGILGEQ